MSRKALFIPDVIYPAVALAREAGALIMEHYRQGRAVDRKADASPVTEADRAADRLIVAGLLKIAPDILIVSEEGQKPDVSQADYFWLVDPLDGTKSFVRGSGYFTVNIALINPAREPVLGVIYDPANRVMYRGSEAGAFRESVNEPGEERIQCRPVPATGPVALISHSHINEATQDYLTQAHVAERVPCASSIKFCLLAEGGADLYPRFGATREWDTAAGHAILAAAGGSVTTPQGAPFLYGKPEFLNGHFVARGKR